MTRQHTIQKEAESPQAARLSASRTTPTDEYAATPAPGGPVRDLTAGRIRPTSAHAEMMAEYYAARDAWVSAREAEALGYRTEEHEFAANHPAPRLADFIKARAS